MRKLVLAIVAAMIAAMPCSLPAELPAVGALRNAPSALLVPLEQRTVRDLIDYALAGMMTHTELNLLGSEARILALDSAKVELQTSPGRVLTLHLLPLKKKTVYCVIETLGGDFSDSSLSIFDSDWNPMPKLWSEPAASAWGKIDSQEPPIVMAEYSFDPASGILTLTNTGEDREKMLPTLRYVWTDKGFKPLKRK